MKIYSPLYNSAPYYRLARAKLVAPWLRADYFWWMSFLNRCDLYFILVFRLKSPNSTFFQRWESWFVSRNSFWYSIFYCIFADLETFFRCVNNICPSLFLGLNSCFNFILDSFKIYLSKITVSVINAMLFEGSTVKYISTIKQRSKQRKKKL